VLPLPVSEEKKALQTLKAWRAAPSLLDPYRIY